MDKQMKFGYFTGLLWHRILILGHNLVLVRRQRASSSEYVSSYNMEDLEQSNPASLINSKTKVFTWSWIRKVPQSHLGIGSCHDIICRIMLPPIIYLCFDYDSRLLVLIRVCKRVSLQLLLSSSRRLRKFSHENMANGSCSNLWHNWGFFYS